MKKGNLLRAALASGVTIVALAQTPACAQDAQPAPGATDVDAQDTGARNNDIVVSGYRQSVEQALSIKRDSDGIVDAIVSDDVAELPDENLSEALVRLPGVTINRENGDGSEVLIRGLASKFNATLVNGMAATGSGGRAFDFSFLASELFRDLRVQKNASAKVVEGGIAGTIELNTPSPFSYRKPTFGVNLLVGYNDVDGKAAPKLSGLWADQFLDGRLSMVFSLAYSQRRARLDQADGNEWNPMDVTLPDGTKYNDVYVLWNMRSQGYIRDYKRLGGTAAIGWKFNDDWNISLNAIRSREHQTYNRYNYEWYVKSVTAATPVGKITDMVVGGKDGRTALYVKVTGGYNRLLTDYQEIHNNFGLYTFDLNGRAGSWTIFARAGYNKSSKTYDVDNSFRFTTPADFSYDFRDNRKIWTPVSSVTNIMDPSIWKLDSVSLSAPSNETDEKLGQLDFARDLPWGPISGVTFGARWDDRETKVESFTISPKANVALGQQALTPSYFDNFLVGVRDLPDGYPRQYLVVDNELDRELFGTSADVPRYGDNSTFNSSDYRNNYSIGERTLAGYLQLKLNQDVFGLPVSGDVGVRVINTRVSGNGFGKQPNEAGKVAVGPMSFTGSETQALPSLNLRARATDKLLVRFSAGRTMSRPDLGDLAPNGYQNPTNLTFDQGNPGLKPFMADQADLSVEWYVNRETLLSAAFFYKDVSGLIVDETTSEDIDGATYQVTRPVNSSTTYKVKGLELSFQQPWSWAPGFLRHFGHILNYTYVTSNQSSDGTPGYTHDMDALSHHLANAILYYEQGPFKARAAWNLRSKYYTGAVDKLPFYQDTYNQLDLSTSYAITRNFQLRAQVINVTNSPIFQYTIDTDKQERYGVSGRTFYFGITGKF